MLQRILLTILFAFGFSLISNSCTSIIVSGKYTKDGRPLMWKNRDTGNLKNVLMYFSDGKYKYVGLVNSKDIDGKSVWIGYNETGFAIMNTNSYNLNDPDDKTKMAGLEGRLMKKALQTCKTVDDFEDLIKSLPRPTQTSVNYGVIDAYGNAAYFELGNFKYAKIDVNDPKIAPFGYVIHSNFSFTGIMGGDGGNIRYDNAQAILSRANTEKTIDERFILQDLSRGLYHSLTNTDLKQDPPAGNETKFVAFQDYIPRYSTASAVVVQGVKKGEAAEFTTLWAVVGWPLSSVVVPVWLKGGSNLPKITMYDKQLKDSPISNKALALKKRCMPIDRTDGRRYLKLNVLYNKEESGIMQKLWPVENLIFDKTHKQMADWRKNGWSKKQVQEYYQWLDMYIQTEYKKLFGI